MDIDLLRREECKPLTTEQMADIKSQFHPSNTANVNIVPLHIYSPEEHIVGYWRETVNNVLMQKPLYEKTITQSGTIGYGNYPHGITNIDRIYVTDFSFTDNGFRYYVNSQIGSGNGKVGVDSTNVKIEFSTSAWSVNQGMMVTLQYTKSTDEWEEV